MVCSSALLAVALLAVQAEQLPVEARTESTIEVTPLGNGLTTWTVNVVVPVRSVARVSSVGALMENGAGPSAVGVVGPSGRCSGLVMLARSTAVALLIHVRQVGQMRAS